MDGRGETPIFHVMIWNHTIETTILIRGCWGYQDKVIINDSLYSIVIYPRGSSLELSFINRTFHVVYFRLPVVFLSSTSKKTIIKTNFGSKQICESKKNGFRNKLGNLTRVSMEVSKLVYNLFRGLTTYLYRGYNPFTKYHGHPSREH